MSETVSVLAFVPIRADTSLTAHGRKHQQAGDDDVPDSGEWLAFEEIIFDDFTADIVLQRDYTWHQHCALYVRRRGKREHTGRGHVGAQTRSGDVDEQVVGTEVVQDVALGSSASLSHSSPCLVLPTWVLSVKVRYPVTAMSRHAIKLIDVDTCVTAANLTRVISEGKSLANETQDSPIERGRVDALVDVHRVVVTHVGEGDHANSLENARSDYGQRSERRASEFLVHGRRAENNRGNDDPHGDQGCSREHDVPVLLQGE